MKPDPLLWQAAQRMIERFDPDHRELLVVFDTGLGIDHVPARRGRRIVELQDKSRIEDGLVLLAHRLGAGIEELLVALVVVVSGPVGAAWSDGSHEALLAPGCLPAPP